MRVTGSVDNDGTIVPSFLESLGEMGAQIARFRWEWHPLGPLETWPDSLKIAVNFMLNSPQPRWLGWGRQMWFLCNDACLDVLGRANCPGALGRPASDVWGEIWDVWRPLANNVLLYGDAGLVGDERLFYTFSFRAIRDEHGAIAGLLCPSVDEA
jgi:hypothetical protein